MGRKELTKIFGFLNWVMVWIVWLTGFRYVEFEVFLRYLGREV